MSWDEVGVSKTKCPCGCGSVHQVHYENDWRSRKDGSVIIDCDVCSKKYKVEEKYFCPKPYHDYTVYYLVPRDYPDYVKTAGAEIVYGPCGRLEDVEFCVYLIEHYPLGMLEYAHGEYSEKGYSASVGISAKQIRGLYRKKYGRVRIKLLLAELQRAIDNYGSYVGNYANRKGEDDKERKLYDEYLRAKEECQIRLDI